jgi:uncharacterized protein (TIGR03437 family)
MQPRFGILIPFWVVSGAALLAQTSPIVYCLPAAQPRTVRAEGLTEQMGDIVLECSGGAPNQMLHGNLSVALSVPITNRLDSNGGSDLVVSLDTGAGPVASSVKAYYQGYNTLSFSGIMFQLSPAGTATLRISNLRGSANYLSPGQQIAAYLSGYFGISLPFSSFIVGNVQRGLYSSYTSRLICSGYGTPNVVGLGLASAVGSNGAYSTVRVTEGFANAFTPRSDPSNFNADFGTRVLLKFSGVPDGARLFAPDVVAGSTALQPTSAGDYGIYPGGGGYQPGANSLLFARVATSDVNGGGIGSRPVIGLPNSTTYFDSMNEVYVNPDGSANLIYEVLDANPVALESATIPVFIYMPAGYLLTYTQVNEDVFLAPVASQQPGAGQPVARFASTVPLNDCSLNADCGAAYFPKLAVNNTTYDISMTTLDRVNNQYLVISNTGSGNFVWNASIQFLNNVAGTQTYPWLQLSQTRGLNRETVVMSLVPGSLPSGVYDALVTIDGGPIAGVKFVRVTMRLTYLAPVPLVLNVVNDASGFGGFVVPGSRVDILGERLNGGGNISITFGGVPGLVLDTSSAQKLVVQTPFGIQDQDTVLIVLTVDGSNSNGILIPVSESAPAIYGKLTQNSDGSLNTPVNGALTGSTISVFATGLPSMGTPIFMGRIADRSIDGDNLVYAGPAPGMIGVQLLEMIVPADLPAMTTGVTVCGGLTPDVVVCSEAADLFLVNPPAPAAVK